MPKNKSDILTDPRFKELPLEQKQEIIRQVAEEQAKAPKYTPPPTTSQRINSGLATARKYAVGAVNAGLEQLLTGPYQGGATSPMGAPNQPVEPPVPGAAEAVRPYTKAAANLITPVPGDVPTALSIGAGLAAPALTAGMSTGRALATTMALQGGGRALGAAMTGGNPVSQGLLGLIEGAVPFGVSGIGKGVKTVRARAQDAEIGKSLIKAVNNALPTGIPRFAVDDLATLQHQISPDGIIRVAQRRIAKGLRDLADKTVATGVMTPQNQPVMGKLGDIQIPMPSMGVDKDGNVLAMPFKTIIDVISKGGMKLPPGSTPTTGAQKLASLSVGDMLDDVARGLIRRGLGKELKQYMLLRKDYRRVAEALRIVGGDRGTNVGGAVTLGEGITGPSAQMSVLERQAAGGLKAFRRNVAEDIKRSVGRGQPLGQIDRPFDMPFVSLGLKGGRVAGEPSQFALPRAAGVKLKRPSPIGQIILPQFLQSTEGQ